MSRETHGVKQERGAFFLEYLVMVSHKAISFFPHTPILSSYVEFLLSFPRQGVCFRSFQGWMESDRKGSLPWVSSPLLSGMSHPPGQPPPSHKV